MSRHPLDEPVETIQDAMTRVYPKPVDKPCNDCPWRRDATPGWLGPSTAPEWLDAVHGEAPIACHKTLDGSSWDGASQCRGAATFRANVLKSPRNASVAEGTDEPDHERVFSSNDEFLAYHERRGA